MVYGTAWKAEQTSDLVYHAIKAGFRAIDTAAQPRHYREDLVGAGVRQAIDEGLVTRKQLFLQTKFTATGSQDLDNMPYDPASAVADQVRASITSSLHNFVTDDADGYIDCLLLHSPLRNLRDTLEAWDTCQEFVPHRIRQLGLANVDLTLLRSLLTNAPIKPTIVQNRFYKITGYDLPIRTLCQEEGLIYQAYWTLTANPQLLSCQPVCFLALSLAVDPAVALYALVLNLQSIVVLNGTTNRTTMLEDHIGLERVKAWSTENELQYSKLIVDFKDLIGTGDVKQN